MSGLGKEDLPAMAQPFRDCNDVRHLIGFFRQIVMANNGASVSGSSLALGLAKYIRQTGESTHTWKLEKVNVRAAS
jgi:hypothetical protein